MRRLSQTQIRAFQTCPMKWKLSYVDRRKEPPSPPLTFGSAVHSGLEVFYRDRISGPAPLDEVLRAFDDELDPDAYDTDEALRRARADGHVMLESWFRNHSADFQPAMAVELALNYSIDEIPMISILDRVDVTDGGGLRITDYKTGRFFLKDRAKESEQLTLYQIAADSNLDREVESLALVHVPSDTEWQVPRRSPEQVASVRRTVLETARAIEREQYEPRVGRQCAWCHVRPWCPAFADEYPENWSEQAEPGTPSTADAARLADALGEAQELKRENEERIRAVQDQLIAWFAATGQRAVAGSAFRVQASRTEKSALACSDEELRAILEPVGLWESVLAPSFHLKTKLLANPVLPPDVQGALADRSEVRVSWRLTPQRLSSPDEE